MSYLFASFQNSNQLLLRNVTAAQVEDPALAELGAQLEDFAEAADESVRIYCREEDQRKLKPRDRAVAILKVVSLHIPLVQLEVALAIPLQLLLYTIVKALVEVKVLYHLKEDLSQLLDLLHHLLGNLVGEVLFILRIFVDGIVLLRQQLQVFFVDVDILSLAHSLQLADAVDSELLIVLL